MALNKPVVGLELSDWLKSYLIGLELSDWLRGRVRVGFIRLVEGVGSPFVSFTGVREKGYW